jgi:signal transduction histidine kinase/CheY-like chemotaxis protein
LADLVAHRESVDAANSIEAVDAFFQHHPHEYAAALHQGRVLGVCSRGHVRGLLGGRYGFSLYHREPVGKHLLPNCVCVVDDTALRDVLETALSRRGEEFYEDIVLVGTDQSFLGLISTVGLVQAQSALVQRQFDLLASQRVELESTNAHLTVALAHQQELERQIVQREKAALVQTLAGGVAHEINNKLVPVIGYAELLLAEVTGLGNPRVEPYIRSMRDSAIEAASIIRQLLQLSKPTPPERSACELGALVDDGLTLIGLRLKEAEISVTVDRPPDPVVLVADAGQLKQVLMNLILNALDAMQEHGGRHLHIGLRACKGVAVLTVRDDGCGIRSEEIGRIFDPFFTTKAPNRGTGLGLSVCLSIVKQHGGDISVDSVHGGGTTFEITLPCSVTPGKVITPPHSEPVAADVQPAARPVVLVVDDEDFVARFVSDALGKVLACQVHRAADGHEAIEYLMRTDFAMVISDVRMPRLNGAELLDWMQKHRPQFVERTVFVTGDASGSSLNAQIEASGVPMLRKPFSLATLLWQSRAILQRAR